MTVMHFCKIISTFYKHHSKKPIAMSSPKNSALPIATSTTKLVIKPLKAHLKKKHKKTLKPFSK